MEISGYPGGIIYLSAGCLCFAESAAVPDLGSRLTRPRRISDDQWKWLLDIAGPAGDIGAHLLDHGLLTRDELRALLWSITLDALVALVAPLSAEPSVASTRFWPERPHWAGSVLRLDPASAWAEAGSKAARLAWQHISVLDRPRLCSLNRPWAVVEHSQWAVACQIDGSATVRELAWRTGLAVCDVAEWVCDLARAGLCTLSAGEAGHRLGEPTAAAVVRTSTRALPPRTGGAEPGAPRGDASSSLPERAAVPPLPRRTPGASLPSTEVSSDAPGGGRHSARAREVPPPRVHPELLRRVLEELKRMT